MKKALDIFLAVLGIGSLVLIGVLIFIGTAMGSMPEMYSETIRDNAGFDNQEADEYSNSHIDIPQGSMMFELYFAEFGGRMGNLPVEILIDGYRITVYNSKTNPLTGGKIITEGILMKHVSGTWIIGDSQTDKTEKEIGGCSGGPTPIDFESKIIEWC